MSARRVVRLVVKGRVQGVGFRAFVEDEANLLALDGWVRNRRDGTVEALVAGPVDQVDLLIAAARCGPPASRVEAVDVDDADPVELMGRSGFLTLPTA
jgi:acylphosphatase